MKGEQGDLCSRNKMCNETGGDLCLRYMIDVDGVHVEYEARCDTHTKCNTTQMINNMNTHAECPPDPDMSIKIAIGIVFLAISFYLAV